MSKKDPYKHTFNTVVELDGADLFEINNSEEFTPFIAGLKNKMKQSYVHCKKPEKLFIYMLATDDMGIIEKMTGGDNGEADN